MECLNRARQLCAWLNDLVERLGSADEDGASLDQSAAALETLLADARRKQNVLRAKLDGMNALGLLDPGGINRKTAWEDYATDIYGIENGIRSEIIRPLSAIAPAKLKALPPFDPVGSVVAPEAGAHQDSAPSTDGGLPRPPKALAAPERLLHIGRDKLWDHDIVMETVRDMLDPERRSYQIYAIEGSPEKLIGNLVERIYRLATEVAGSRRLLVVRLALNQKSYQQLAHKILYELWSSSQVLGDDELQDVLLCACNAIDPSSPRKSSNKISSAQVDKMLADCFAAPAVRSYTIVLLLHDYQSLEDEAGRWLRDFWIGGNLKGYHQAHGNLRVIITGAKGLSSLEHCDETRVKYQELPIMAWEDFHDWARHQEGFHLSEDDIAEDVLKGMYERSKESTKKLYDMLDFFRDLAAVESELHNSS